MRSQVWKGILLAVMLFVAVEAAVYRNQRSSLLSVSSPVWWTQEQVAFAPILSWRILSWRTQEQIEAQLDARNFCEVDADCVSFYGECPFACAQVIHQEYLDDAKALINAFLVQQQRRCVYKCKFLDQFVCLPLEKKCVFLRKNTSVSRNF